MNPIYILGALAILYLLHEKNGASFSASISTRPQVLPPLQLPQETGFRPTDYGGTTAAGQQGLNMVGGALNAIPVVGSLFNAITGGLLAASKKRAQEAIDENKAIGEFIPYFDHTIKQIFDALNTGGVTPAEADTLLDQLEKSYWDFLTPHVQPGRFGCAGDHPLHTIVGGSGYGACGDVGDRKCSGDWGAACCVGVALIDGTVANLKWLIRQPNGGQTSVCPLIGNKYGGSARSAYTVSYKPFHNF